jgi:hypothetical protein
MKRRLSLARALVNDPRLLLLDEPTTGLDPQARHLMWERLQLLLQQGKSILLTTHFMDEAERLCHRLLVLDHGRKIAEGKPRDLIAEHLEPDVVEVYGVGALALAESDAGPATGPGRAGGGQRRDRVLLHPAQARPLLAALAAHPQLRTLHRPANLEDLFLKLTGARSGRTADHEPGFHRFRLGRAALVDALVAGVFAQPAGVAQAGHSQPGGQHCRAADVAGGLWLRHGRAGGAGELGGAGQAVPYILFLASGSICMSAMNAASFEALYSAFSRMHVQKTWDGIMNAPISWTTWCWPRCCGPPSRRCSP